MTDNFDYGDFKTDKPLGDNALARLQGLVQESLNCEALVASLDAQVKEAKKSLAGLNETAIPDLLDELDIQDFTVKNGAKVELTETIRGNIKKADRGAAHAWLEENGYQGLVKRQIKIEFGKQDEKWAAKFERDCGQRKRPLNMKRTEEVHSSTLQAFVRTELEKGVDLPMALLGVYRQRVAKITPPK